MRNDLFDVLAIGTGEAAKRNVLVPNFYFEALAHEALDQLHLRALAQIVGAGFEAQSELCNFLFARVYHHFDGTINVLGIARHERLEQWKFEIELFGFVGDGSQILRKAGTAEGEARRKICGRNVQFGVGGKNFRDRVRVDAEMLAHGSHFVGEANFQRVITVGKIFHHFSNRDGRLVESARSVLVKLAQRREVLGVAGAENGRGRVQEVGDGAAFAHKLRVVANGEVLAAFLAALFFKDGEDDRFVCSGEHRTAQNKNVRRFFLADGGADFPGNALDVAEVELAIFQARRSDADERDFRIQHG